MKQLSWVWIAVMAIGPAPIAFALAYACWRMGEYILGNLAATAVIAGAAFALIFRESMELDRLVRQCLDAGFVCKPEPSAFARYAIYSAIALAEIVAVFMISLSAEHRTRERRYAPEWQRR